jgi:hypothetical protein
MALKRQVNFLGNQRVDVPHMRLLESAVAADFQALSGTFMSGSHALVASGVVILDVGMAGQPANTLVLRMANAVLLHGTASEAGALYTVESSRPDDVLSAANSSVVGFFSPGVTNYIALDLVRTADATTTDTVVFRSAATKEEFTQVVPLGRVLNYTINISTSNFGATPTLCPVAKVITDANNNIVSITDCRQMFFRLGSGGTTPDPLAQYAWSNRNETTSTSSFTGGDKDITSQFSFNGAVLQRLWELGGGEHWYSPADDRSVKLTYATPMPWSWDGTNLTWSGLTFVFANSTAEANVVADQVVADAATFQPSTYVGLTNLADGDVIYVDLDRTAGGTITAHRAQRSWLFLNPPALPGHRRILAWRVGTQVFAGDDNVDVTVTVPLPVATNVILGAVLLNYASSTPLTPKVPVINASDWAVASGMDTNVPGAMSFGVVTATSLVFAQNGVTSTFNGQLGATRGVVVTQGTANTNAVTATGSGSGYGVSGTGGQSNAVQPGAGVYGKGGAGSTALSSLFAAGAGVYGKGGTSTSPFHSSAGVGGYFEGGEYLSSATIGGVGVYGKGWGTGTGGVFEGGPTNGTGITGSGGTGTNAVGVSGGAGDGGVAGVFGNGSATVRAGGLSAGVYGVGGGGGFGGLFEGSGAGDGVKGTGGGSGSGYGVHGVAGNVSGGVGVYGEGGISTPASGVMGVGKGTGSGVVATAGATGANLSLTPRTGDPAAPTNGDVWYNDTTSQFKGRAAARSRVLGPTGFFTATTTGSGVVTVLDSDGCLSGGTKVVTGGNVVVTFATALANANYCVQISALDNLGGTRPNPLACWLVAKTVNGFTIQANVVAAGVLPVPHSFLGDSLLDVVVFGGY